MTKQRQDFLDMMRYTLAILVLCSAAFAAGAVRAAQPSPDVIARGHSLTDAADLLQQTRRESRMATHCRPLGAVEPSALAEERRVDRDLAEIVQAAGPAQAVDVGEG